MMLLRAKPLNPAGVSGQMRTMVLGVSLLILPVLHLSAQTPPQQDISCLTEPSPANAQTILDRCTRIIQNQSESSQARALAHYRRAAARMLLPLNQNQRNLVASDINESIKLDSSSGLYFYSRAIIRHQEGDNSGALSDINQSISLVPISHELRLMMAIIYYNLNHNDRAMDGVTSALHLNPRWAEAIFWRGIVRIRLNQRPDAHNDFSDAIHYNPSLAEAWANRALLRRSLGDEAGARSDLAQAARLDARFASTAAGTLRQPFLPRSPQNLPLTVTERAPAVPPPTQNNEASNTALRPMTVGEMFDRYRTCAIVLNQLGVRYPPPILDNRTLDQLFRDGQFQAIYQNCIERRDRALGQSR